MYKYLRKWYFSFTKQMEKNTLIPPSCVRGMQVLDRCAFQKKVKFPGLLVPVQSIKKCKNILRSHLPNLNMKLVVDSPNADDKLEKIILLDPGAPADIVEKFNLDDLGVKNKFLFKEITIGYENFKPREIFQAVLPAQADEEHSVSPAGFCQIGHIIQLNLREHQLPYRKIIGEVFLDKIPSCKTVVNKVETIRSEYRNLDMELLAGENNFLTTVVEHNRRYELDFSKVFWNSRLSTEHNRIASIIPSADAVFDACAGVGPFSIPLARKGCQVYANDLNPDCHHWLQHNVKLNKVKTMQCYNMDGREFIKDVLGTFLSDFQSESTSTAHVIVNLPGIAVEFLDAFPGLLQKQRRIPVVKVYFYIFASKELNDAKEEINARVTKHFGRSLPPDAEIRRVRDIAPSKDQFCVCFILSNDVLFRTEDEDDCNEPDFKKLKAYS